MSKYEAVFVMGKGPRDCRMCNKRVEPKCRIVHVMKHASDDMNCKIYSCLKCVYSTHASLLIQRHVRMHIEAKEQKDDETIQQEMYIDGLKKHRKIINDIGVSCFNSPIDIVKKQAGTSTGGDGQMEDDETDDEVDEATSSTNPSSSMNSVDKVSDTAIYESVFVIRKGPESCRKCRKHVNFKHRVGHVLKHVSEEMNLKLFPCVECRYETHLIQKIKKHVRQHIKNKEKRNDPNEIRKLYIDGMRNNQTIVDEMAILCFESKIQKVKRRTNGSKDSQVEISEDEDEEMDYSPANEPASYAVHMDEGSPGSSGIHTNEASIKSEDIHQIVDWKQIDGGEGLNYVKSEVDDFSIRHDNDVMSEQNECGGSQSLLPNIPPATTIASEDYNKYRLQKQWDTEELMANMRIVGTMLKFSERNIDKAVEVLSENFMDGASLYYEGDNLGEFFKQCQVAYGVKTTITKILQVMRSNEIV